MQQVILEPRPLYGIGTVARLTGLKPDTLRVWERRYGLGASHKSVTGRRQYTQSDLEHLQLIAALVGHGVRIGEIAKSERKTLEVLLRRHGSAESALPESKPRVLFIGANLCDWLDEHQGCLAPVDAQLARVALTAIQQEQLDSIQPLDLLVVECGTLAHKQVTQVQNLAKALVAARVLVTYQCCSEQWLAELEQRDIAATQFPPEPGFLAFEMARSVTEKATSLGVSNVGELVAARPRQFSEQELSTARALPPSISCGCPEHITDLIRALASFEEYSASCAVENWQDAAVHSCIYSYTGQARWLMEKALQAALEVHAPQSGSVVQTPSGAHLDDAA